MLSNGAKVAVLLWAEENRGEPDVVLMPAHLVSTEGGWMLDFGADRTLVLEPEWIERGRDARRSSCRW